MGHGRARLTPFGRWLLAHRVEELHWPVTQAAASMGISRPTAYKWLARWRADGQAGLTDRSSRPHHSPRKTAALLETRILQARRRCKLGPRRLAPMLGLPHATISAVLQRHGLSRLRDADRATGVPIRYVREHPGELIHLDTKHLGRIPLGGGHRQLGRAAAPHSRRRGLGYEVLHVAVDDASRLAFVQLLPDDRGPTSARFLLSAAAFFAEHGIRIQRVMTDRAFNYTVARAFGQAVGTLQLRHKITRPYRPQTNGKAERFIQTLLAEWAYVRLYRSNEERNRALPKWLRHYNHSRPHTALGGQCPIAVCKQRP
jgi:transposase InsO family protein